MKKTDGDLAPISVLLIFYSLIVYFLSNTSINIRIGSSLFIGALGLIGIYKAMNFSYLVKKYLLVYTRYLRKLLFTS